MWLWHQHSFVFYIFSPTLLEIWWFMNIYDTETNKHCRCRCYYNNLMFNVYSFHGNGWKNLKFASSSSSSSSSGYKVTVLVRDPTKLPADHNASRVVVGDVLNLEDVKKTMEGQDAVIIVLGTRNDLSKSKRLETHTHKCSRKFDMTLVKSKKRSLFSSLFILQMHTTFT